MKNNEKSDRTKWNCSSTFLLSMIGSAVGLGNIWRYPYILYSNGGGSFLFVYLIAILLVGIPSMLLEYGVGTKYKTCFPKIMKTINPKLEVIGWLVPLTTFLILVYYACVIGWDGIYFILSFFKGWGANTDYFFSQTLLQSTNSVSGLSYFAMPALIAVFIIWLMAWFISHRNINNGIGKLNKVGIPLLFIVMGIIILYSLTLNGASYGLIKLFTPNWNAIWDPIIWIAAISQIYFSLSLGQAEVVTYASYLPESSRLTRNAIIITIANCGFELCVAIGIFSILGFMSTTTGIGINDLVTQGTGLAFIVFPEILNVMGSAAYILGPLFFISIFFAGMTSTMSLLEPIVSGIEEKFDLTRKRIVSYLCIIGFTMTLIFTTGLGNHLLELVDGFLVNVGIVVCAILGAIIFSWFIGTDELLDIINTHSRIKIGKWWGILMKYVLPIVLIYIVSNGIIKIFSDMTYVQIVVDIALIIILITVPIVLTLVSSKNKVKF
ncbi:MAG: sodium-dependent transporter [Methanobrevibacter sp. CfCl-M3]